MLNKYLFYILILINTIEQLITNHKADVCEQGVRIANRYQQAEKKRKRLLKRIENRKRQQKNNEKQISDLHFIFADFIKQ